MDESPQNTVSDHAPPNAPNTHTAPLRLHPPTSPGPVEPEALRRVWPTAVGVVIIVWQSLGLLITLATAASLFIDYGSFMGQMGVAPAMEAQRAWRPAFLLSYAVVSLLTLVAIAGAVLLLYRKRLAPTLLIIWALLRIPHALLTGWITARAQMDTMAAMPTAATPAMPPAFSDFMYWGTFVTTALWLLVLPTFLLIWFLVPPIRRQTRQWA
ncbi:MAG: hypothetical protein KF902_03720 [Phycisphaeraceae bacterium]|nr:hypothetical protein [Phycisphaeraceae bacterium]